MIVYHSFIDNLRVEWNGQNTYNVFYGQQNVDCFTNYSAGNSEYKAGRIARQWVMDNVWSA